MNIKEALVIIDGAWIRKRDGYRVHFQKLEGSEIVTKYSPGEEDNPLDSDVAAWRMAWKLAQSTGSDGSEIREGELVNLYVVDDKGERVKYYATNQFGVFNPKNIEADREA